MRDEGSLGERGWGGRADAGFGGGLAPSQTCIVTLGGHLGVRGMSGLEACGRRVAA